MAFIAASTIGTITRHLSYCGYPHHTNKEGDPPSTHPRLPLAGGLGRRGGGLGSPGQCPSPSCSLSGTGD